MLNNDNKQKSNQKVATNASSKDSANASSSPLPSISLPKGGGAIRGIGEKFSANPVTGTGSMTVPIATSPGRSGFGPQLSLSYDSGADNGPFGFGWHLSLPAITRKTDKGLPRYLDDDESDVFILSGAEDLVPILDASGQRVHVPRPVNNITYKVSPYRPRIEGLFARIERWTNISDPQDTFWRSISRDNITTWYGKTAESRIADPTNPARIFSWLICETYDDKGNVCVYQYKPEDSGNVDLSQANECNRSDITRSANRYLKYVLYGNQTPYFPNLTGDAPVALPSDWHFELVFDYGEHDKNEPQPRQAPPWPCRADPFSTYRATFEVRTYRLCQRALMFHHFADEASAGLNCLVRSTDFTYTQPPPSDPTRPFYSFLLSVRQTGYAGNAPGASLPPLEFTYSEAVIDETIRDVDPASLENLPYGLDGTNYRWVDLDGEGLSGMLTEQAGSWFYKPNLSPAHLQAENGVVSTLAQFGPVELVARQPSLSALRSGRQQLLDLSGDGRLDLVEFDSPTPGFFERTGNEGWKPFTPFTRLPVLDWGNPNLKFVDLTGDGFADLLISEDEAFWWNTSLAAEGFGPAQRVPQALDEEQGPRLIFADGTESIFLADLSGDGLTDLARIRNGEVCYWPNLGYGHFGPKVTMDRAPWFEAPDLFDGRRIRLADIDGSGTADLVYFASDGVRLYFNQSGNAWGEARALSQFPSVESVSSAAVLDLLGNGTACLVWSSPLPDNISQPMCYVDLMGGQKPHLLIQAINNLGAETRVQYAPSTRFYVTDKLAGTPWLTRIPFPVHVVECVETYDYISRNRFVTRYAYHHGYYDGYEREFRGFGMVEQWDTEELAVLTAGGQSPPATNEDDASYVPPVYTRTWFHTGVFFARNRISRHFEEEYYHEPALSAAQLQELLLDDTALPTTLRLPDGSSQAFTLSADEAQESCRSLKGSILRQEIYAQDGTEAQDRPYSASEYNYTIELLQPQGINRHAVFFTHARESVDLHYERALFAVGSQQVADPRVTHTITLAVDSFGNVQQSATVAYGRRYADPDPRLSSDDVFKQQKMLYTYTDNHYTNAVPPSQDPTSLTLSDVYRVPLLCDTCTYELVQVPPDVNSSQATKRLSFDTLSWMVQTASDGNHELSYEDIDATRATTAGTWRRPIEHSRSLYRSDDLSGPLKLGTVDSMALPFETYRLAFTSGLITSVYQRQSGGSTEALLPDPVSVLGSEGGYARSNDLKAVGLFPASDPDDHWWIHSGRIFYSPNSNDPAAQELSYARQYFFLPRRFQDAFGQMTTITYDDYGLLVQETQDALGNCITAGERDPHGNLTSKSNDYRVLQPALIMDANRNRSAVAFDILGMVVGTAVMGKPLPEKVEGDTLDGFNADLSDTFIAAHLQDPLTNPQEILQQATTRLVYDLFAYWRTKNDPQPQPAVVYTLARETHASDLGANQQTKFQHHFSYSDGFGREIQKKLQAEPLGEGTPAPTPRWVGSGWTIYNNKGKPVRQYEPFFSATHHFEFAMAIGVSPTLFYDPVERAVATLHPNYTYEKVVFDPWKQISWDVNDTVLLDPKTDPDVGAFFQRLPDTDYLPTWYDQRQSGSLSTKKLEKEAAAKAAVHANTPTTAYFDTLGHTFLTMAHNRFLNSSNAPVDAYYPARSTLDIQGRQRAVSDEFTQANQLVTRLVMRYDYDMPGNRIHQASMEAGERWMLADVNGKPIYAWDSRGHTLRTVYDELRRPIEVHLSEDNGQSWVLVGRTIYGESQLNPEQQNLRGKAYQVYDQAGLVTSENYDFKGNLLNSSRQLVDNSSRLYTKTVDWSTAGPLEAQSYTSSTTYDALNRPVSLTTPDASVIQYSYNEASLLEQVAVSVQGASSRMLVSNIDYNAKGQRTLIEYGSGASAQHPSGVSTQYTYDPLTFRLVNLLTQRDATAFPNDCPQPPPTAWPGCQVQNLSYTYDPIGNITHMQDDAQQTIYFNNRRVEPSADYTYDAIYRLIAASGREHLGQGQAPIPLSDDDGLRMGLAQPGDGQAMGTYLQQYDYDEAGNILHMSHQGIDPANPPWTLTYAYNEPSKLEAGKYSNRLTSTRLGNGLLEPYTYDIHGNMTGMPHFSLMRWDYRDQLQATSKQIVTNGGTPETTYYVYDAGGQRVRKITEGYAAPGQIPTLSKERIYLGAFEIYREYSTGPGGTVAPSLERETLHVMDDMQRIALVETRTLGSDNSPQQLTRYQFSNHLGTACLELDDGAQVISYEEYYPYGSTSYQALGGQTETPKRYRYTGKERDEESRLYYHGARYYAAWLARWVSCDPKGTSAGSDNLYEYVHSCPITHRDGNGMQAGYFANKEPESAPWYLQGWERTKQDFKDLWDFVTDADDRAGPPTPPQPIIPGSARPPKLILPEIEWRPMPSELGRQFHEAKVALAGVAATFDMSVTFTDYLFPAAKFLPLTGESALERRAVGLSFEELGTGSMLDKTSGYRWLLRRETETMATFIVERAGLSRQERGPVLSAVLDVESGELFFGLNIGRKGHPPTDAELRHLLEELHPLLKERYQEQRLFVNTLTEEGKMTINLLKAGEPGTHSEIIALNNALKAKEARLQRSLTAADLDSLLVNNRSLNTAASVDFVPHPCSNCCPIIRGTTFVP